MTHVTLISQGGEKWRERTNFGISLKIGEIWREEKPTKCQLLGIPDLIVDGEAH